MRVARTCPSGSRTFDGSRPRSTVGSCGRRDAAHRRLSRRRPKASCRAGSGSASPSAGPSSGTQKCSFRRAALEPRCRAARQDAGRDRQAPQAARHDHGLRHPRPGRGHDHGAEDRGPERAAGSSRSARPLDLFERPANLFVAGFIGSPRMNLYRGQVTGTAPLTVDDRKETGPVESPRAAESLARGYDASISASVPRTSAAIPPGPLPAEKSIRLRAWGTRLSSTARLVGDRRPSCTSPATSWRTQDDVMPIAIDPDHVALFRADDGRAHRDEAGLMSWREKSRPRACDRRDRLVSRDGRCS